MKFLIDHNLPVALARWMASKGVDVKHVETLGFHEKDDVYLWQYAVRENRIVISKDQDFVNLSARWGDRGRLLWCSFGNFRRRELISYFKAALPQILEAFETGQRLVELE